MDNNGIQIQLTSWYGAGTDGSVPRREQWARVLDRDPDHPLTLINFFKFREVADYGNDTGEISGREAFDLYATISIPTMERIGGTFLLVAPFETTFIGKDEDWDLIAIGSYPDQHSFLDLYQDPDYRVAFKHRTAACVRQKVLVAAA